MKKFNPPMLAAVAAVAVVITLLISLYLSGVAYKVPDDIVSILDERLPNNEQIFEQNIKIAGEVQINNDNVKQVIKSLARPHSYKATITNTLFYDGVHGSVSCIQSVMNGAYRVDYLTNAGIVEHSQITYDGIGYAFTPYSNEYNTFNVGSFSSNSDAMIPSYQTILDYPENYITGSRMYEENGQMIIEVDTQIGKKIGIYRISLKNGLLHSADFSEDGKMIRQVQIIVSDDMPSSNDFILAGQTKPVYDKS